MDEKTRVDKSIYYLKNNKVTAPIIVGAIILTSILAFGKTFSESLLGTNALEKKAKEKEERVRTLERTIDTIKQSLKIYDFILVNNKVVPTVNNAYYSKNATGVNYGQVGDVYNETKTYNHSLLTKQNEPIKIVDPENGKQHIVEIESIRSPIIKKDEGGQSAVYILKTKNTEEASNAACKFLAVSRYKGELYLGANGYYKNTTVVTNYPTEFSCSFELPGPTADSIYIFLKITFTNSIGQSQIPFQMLYRKIYSNGSLVRLYTGTKEYKEVVEKIFVSDPMNPVE